MLFRSKRISECLGKFQEATSAQINWSKSTALLLGQWLQESPPRLPQQCSWNLEGFKVLDVFFGADAYMQKNWDGLREPILVRLERWKWALPQLSYRGRALVINNLAASMMWHRLTVLDPPVDLLNHVQKAFVDFFYGWVSLASTCSTVSAPGGRRSRANTGFGQSEGHATTDSTETAFRGGRHPLDSFCFGVASDLRWTGL